MLRRNIERRNDGFQINMAECVAAVEAAQTDCMSAPLSIEGNGRCAAKKIFAAQRIFYGSIKGERFYILASYGIFALKGRKKFI